MSHALFVIEQTTVVREVHEPISVNFNIHYSVCMVMNHSTWDRWFLWSADHFKGIHRLINIYFVITFVFSLLRLVETT